MKSTITLLASISFLLTITLSSCTKDNEEELFAEENTDDDGMATTLEDVSFSADVQAILSQNCNFGGCHTAGAPPFIGDLTTYAEVKARVDNGRLNFKFLDPATRDMPKGSPEAFPKAQRDLIQRWIDEGAKDN